MWYEGISHQYASAGTNVKVICKGQGQIERLHFSNKRTMIVLYRSPECYAEKVNNPMFQLVTPQGWGQF